MIKTNVESVNRENAALGKNLKVFKKKLRVLKKKICVLGEKPPESLMAVS